MRAFFVSTLVMFLGVAAGAAETITYRYDAQGRLVQASRAGSVNDGFSTTYTYDDADNRAFVSTRPVSLYASDASVTEGGTLIFTVTKAGTGTALASYAFRRITVDGTDYTGSSGSLSFTASETTKQLSAGTVNDTEVEDAETLKLDLTSLSSSVTIAKDGVGTIIDND